MSTKGCKGSSPLQMYTCGMLSLKQQQLQALDLARNIDLDYGSVGTEMLDPKINAIEVHKVSNPLSVSAFEVLQSELNPLTHERN